MGWVERVSVGREGVGLGREGGWAERGRVGRGSNRLEGAKRPFGRERSEPSFSLVLVARSLLIAL